MVAIGSPFSLVDHPEFKKFVEMLRPGVHLADRKRVGGELLDQVCEREKSTTFRLGLSRVKLQR